MKLPSLLFAFFFLCRSLNLSQANFFLDLVHDIEEQENEEIQKSDDYETIFDSFVKTNEAMKTRSALNERPKLRPQVVEDVKQSDGCATGPIPGAKFFDEHPDPQR